MGDAKPELMQGTLDLIIMNTLSLLGELHGYGIARRIEQISGETFVINQGTIYPALMRLKKRKHISSRWGVSENNRKARFYSLTARGKAQLREDQGHWAANVALMAKFLS